jgi:hypothetical protein
MYSSINQSYRYKIYDKLCDDTMETIFSFLGDEDKIEMCKVNERMYQYVYKFSPYFFIDICKKCKHHRNFCKCKNNTMYLATCGLLFSVGIIILSIILMILYYHHII